MQIRLFGDPFFTKFQDQAKKKIKINFENHKEIYLIAFISKTKYSLKVSGKKLLIVSNLPILKTSYFDLPYPNLTYSTSLYSTLTYFTLSYPTLLYLTLLYLTLTSI